ncbi:MAG: ABC transporter substrate-binding protein [Mesorhizobium sp.]|nr:MAG: ABC transporter substrate-binding protein [Mesorhizobium sp.]
MHDQITSLIQGGMDRRRFLQTAAVTALATAAFPRAGLAEAPRKGGVLRLGLNGGSSADTFDPTQLIGTFSINVSRQVYNTLVEIGDDGKPAPELAASWETSDGNKRWILNLRPGVQFHNGKAFDAEDVKYSLGLHLGEKTKSKAKGLVADIADVRAASPRQVEILLKSPNPDMDYVLSDLHFAMVPAGFADWAKPVGTGKLTAFQPGVRATASRNEAYWRSDRGHVDTVESVVINDMTARVSALQGGSVHIINGVDYKIAPLLKKDPRAYLVVTEGKQHFSLPMDATKEPFNNPDIVLALKHALDRKQMVDLLMAGYGRVGNDHPIAASDPNFNPNIEQRAYDPDKARFHLKKAGKSELTLELHAAPVAFEQAVSTAELFAQSAKPAGITVGVKREPDDGYWAEVWMKKPWVASFWAGRPSASMMFSSVYASGAPWNETHWKNEDFDRKLAESRSFADPAKRREVYFELQQTIHDTCPTIIPAFASWVDAARAEVKGFTPNPNFLLSDHRVAERVWLEA